MEEIRIDVRNQTPERLAEQKRSVELCFKINQTMPTSDECQELLDGTTQEWVTSYHGIDGYIIRSNKNSNTIFLPAAGFASDGLCYMGVYCNYSTSVSTMSNSRTPLDQQYDNSLSMNNDCNRSLGISIRPVYVGE